MSANTVGLGSLDHLGPKRGSHSKGIDAYFPIRPFGGGYSAVIGNVTKQIDGLLTVVLIGDSGGNKEYELPANIGEMRFVSVRLDGSIDWHSDAEKPLGYDEARRLIVQYRDSRA